MQTTVLTMSLTVQPRDRSFTCGQWRSTASHDESDICSGKFCDQVPID